MSRPLRIEYDDAFYHVMNRGKGRQNIFHEAGDYEDFLRCLTQAHTRFGAEVHAYCLMSNHYHLLLKTPRGNLSRIMRISMVSIRSATIDAIPLMGPCFAVVIKPL